MQKQTNPKATEKQVRTQTSIFPKEETLTDHVFHLIYDLKNAKGDSKILPSHLSGRDGKEYYRV